jgi:hypothetical protein
MSMEKRRSDHVLAIIKAGISAVPVIGGSIASLITDYVPSSTQRSLEKAVELLRDQLKRLEGRIDPDAVDKDEFAELVKTCYLAIIRTNQESKLQAAAALLANLLLRKGDPAKLSYTELDHFARCVDSLSIGATTVLGIAYDSASPQNPGSLP